MVGPGQDPHTYEPTPQQMAQLAGTKIYFRIGVAFEDVWIRRIAEANPAMQIIDTRKDVQLLPMAGHDYSEKGEGPKDPHIWLSPRLVKIQARSICEALCAIDTANETFYTKKLKAFKADLDSLDAEFMWIFLNLKGRSFMVCYPAWGYFADDYGLEQIPIELEGKDLNALALAKAVDLAKEKGIRAIVVQKHCSKKNADSIAQAIGGKVVELDPLAKNYLVNMRKVAKEIRKTIK
jgi:zinc transport system substrate-binding protein